MPDDDYTPTLEDALNHALSLEITANIINAASAYLNSENGSVEEGLAETDLTSLLMNVAKLDVDVVGDVFMAFASMILTIASAEDVQKWFGLQATLIKDAAK